MRANAAATPTSWVGFIVYVYRFFTSFFVNPDSEGKIDYVDSSSSSSSLPHRDRFTSFESLHENATYITWLRHALSDAFYVLFLDWEDESQEGRSACGSRADVDEDCSLSPAASSPRAQLFGYELPSIRRMLICALVTLVLFAYFFAKLYVFYRKATAPTHPRRNQDVTTRPRSTSSSSSGKVALGMFAWIRSTPLRRLFGDKTEALEKKKEKKNGCGAEDPSGATSDLTAHTTHLQTLLLQHSSDSSAATTASQPGLSGKRKKEDRKMIESVTDDTQWNACNEKLIAALPAQDRVSLRDAMPLFSFFAALCGDERFDVNYRVRRWPRSKPAQRRAPPSPESDTDPINTHAAWSKMHAGLRRSVSPLVLGAMMRAVKAQYGTRIAAVPFETVTVKETTYTIEEDEWKRDSQNKEEEREEGVPVKIVNCVALLYFERSASSNPTTVVAVDAETVEDITADFSNDYLLHGPARPAIAVQCQASWIEYRGGASSEKLNGVAHDANDDSDDPNSWAPWYIRDLRRCCCDASNERSRRFRITRFLMRPFVTANTDNTRALALSSSLDVLQYLKGKDLQPFVERFLSCLFTPARTEEAIRLLLPEKRRKYSQTPAGEEGGAQRLQKQMREIVTRCGGMKEKVRSSLTNDSSSTATATGEFNGAASSDVGALELIYVASRTVRATSKNVKTTGKETLTNAGETPSQILAFHLRYVVCGVRSDVDVEVFVVVRDLQCFVSDFQVFVADEEGESK